MSESRKITTRLRDKLTGQILSAISGNQAELKEIRRAQLEINHRQLELLNELQARTKNSGTVQLSETEIVTKIFSGLKLYLDPRDIAVVPHLALDSIWEHEITAAWLSVVRPHDVVLDIGANFGYFAALAAQKTDKKQSKVVLFEANPHLVPYLEKTLSVNWLNEQSVIENLAISDKAGYVDLHILKDYLGSSSLHDTDKLATYLDTKMHLETQETVRVEAVTVDGYCQDKGIERIDLVKMDIEGLEDKAYDGMAEMVRRSPDLTLFVEFTKEAYDDPQGFYNRLLRDFGHVYVIRDGQLEVPSDTDYTTVIGNGDDWTMPVFSKRNLKELNDA